MGTLVALSLFLAHLSRAAPQAYIGCFGLVPVVIGTAKLLDSRMREVGKAPEANSRELVAQLGKTLTIAAVVASNGADNLGTYVPLFAGVEGSEIAVIVVVFVTLNATWCGVAFYLTRHRALRALIQSWGRALLPWILITIGSLVLFKTGAFGLLLGWPDIRSWPIHDVSMGN
jgi:cadmium resistance protein CadD (predicted permease)